jgi:hypothetical protein
LLAPGTTSSYVNRKEICDAPRILTVCLLFQASREGSTDTTYSLQKLTDTYVKKVDGLFKEKEKVSGYLPRN